MSDDRELDRRGFLQALATVAAAPVVPLGPLATVVAAPVVPLGPLCVSRLHGRRVSLSDQLYRLNQPILFIPGMKFEVKFQ